MIFRYIIVVEHDLSVLDYLSDFICCLYGVPSAYGVVTMPFSVREGNLKNFSQRSFTLMLRKCIVDTKWSVAVILLIQNSGLTKFNLTIEYTYIRLHMPVVKHNLFLFGEVFVVAKNILSVSLFICYTKMFIYILASVASLYY